MSPDSFSSARKHLSATIGLRSILRDHTTMSGVKGANVLLALSSQLSSRSGSAIFMDSLSPVRTGIGLRSHKHDPLVAADDLKDEDIWRADNPPWYNAGDVNSKSPLLNDLGAVYENGGSAVYDSPVLAKAEVKMQRMSAAEGISPTSENGFGPTHPFANWATSGLSTLSADNGSSVLFQVPSNVSSPSWIIPSKTDSTPRCSQPQSAPVNVPHWSKLIKADTNHKGNGIVENDEEDDEEWEEQLPPHELVAREYARSQGTAFSVCEGQGRTLKGRDMSRVRNAIWSKIGFAD